MQVPPPVPAPAWPAYYDDEINLREYFDVLRRRWLMVLGIPLETQRKENKNSTFFMSEHERYTRYTRPANFRRY